MNREKRIYPDTEEGVTLKSVPSIMEDDYLLLRNKPAINGVTLTTATTSEELGLLSRDGEEYELTTLGQAKDRPASMIGLTDEGEPVKVDAADFGSATIDVKEKLTCDVRVGDFVFLKI